MSGVFDSDIVIDYLNGNEQASEEFASYPERIISRITWMEALARPADAADEDRIRTVLTRFRIVELTPGIAERATLLRRTHTPKLKFPDAIIYATAQEQGCKLLTRNTRDFSSTAPDVIVPYTL